jgi:hypothetical protein
MWGPLMGEDDDDFPTLLDDDAIDPDDYDYVDETDDRILLL